MVQTDMPIVSGKPCALAMQTKAGFSGNFTKELIKNCATSLPIFSCMYTIFSYIYSIWDCVLLIPYINCFQILLPNSPILCEDFMSVLGRKKYATVFEDIVP